MERSFKVLTILKDSAWVFVFILLGIVVMTDVLKANVAPSPDISKAPVIVERDYVKDKAATIGSAVGSVCTLNAIIDGRGESNEETLRRMIICYKQNFDRFGYSFEGEVYAEALGKMYVK